MSEKDRKPQSGAPNPTEEPPESESDVGLEGAAAIEGVTHIVTAADVEAAVRGAAFPATARDLVDRARQNGADDWVLERIAELPERRLTSLGDALRQLDMLS